MMLKISGPLSYVLMGLLIAALIYSAFLTLRGYLDNVFPHPPTIVSTLMVPDFKKGENPIVQYQRTISATFQGEFYVEVKNALTGETVCNGKGSSLYSPSDRLPKNIHLDWYINDDCGSSIEVGQYFIETNFVMTTTVGSEFYLSTSNIFNVLS